MRERREEKRTQQQNRFVRFVRFVRHADVFCPEPVLAKDDRFHLSIALQSKTKNRGCLLSPQESLKLREPCKPRTDQQIKRRSGRSGIGNERDLELPAAAAAAAAAVAEGAGGGGRAPFRGGNAAEPFYRMRGAQVRKLLRMRRIDRCQRL
eukprot:COSAG06_NODE_1306_length_9917_cov_12.542167_8_plen_151_part_00